MRFNINNPAFLQDASNSPAKQYISFVAAVGNPQVKVSCVGDIEVISTYNGTQTQQKLSDLTEQIVTIQSDANTEIVLNGTVTYFNCEGNQLTTLDVSACTALTDLYCADNQLTNIDVRKNAALKKLSCATNQLTTLDISANKALTNLYCVENQLATLDVSANTELTYLNCEGNLLTTLDVSANTKLTYLSCSTNLLTNLDVSANTELIDLYCVENQLTTLDISANTKLTHLYCAENPAITTIDAIATNSQVANSIADLINNATSTAGTVTLQIGDTYNSTISDTATSKGWTVSYINA